MCANGLKISGEQYIPFKNLFMGAFAMCLN